jgi:2-oxoglutarate ferredoxin oxidoreductase subunit beta
MDMTVMLFDNNVYGLTKKQTSPTSPQGLVTNTHPSGAWLPPLNVVQTMLGFTNVSFVARTVDWNLAHLYQTLRTAYHHRGLSFVHILQRCTAYTPDLFDLWRNDPSHTLLLTHEDGVPLEPTVAKMYKNQLEHDPSDMTAARNLAEPGETLPIGLFYRNPDAPLYDAFTNLGMGMPVEEKLAALDRELERFAI